MIAPDIVPQRLLRAMYSPRAACLEMQALSVKRQDRAVLPAFVRLHKCGYCGTNFQSHEKKSVETTDYPLPPIAKLKKKPHIKKRGA